MIAGASLAAPSQPPIGWFAFDEATRKQLRVIEANGVDRFGEKLHIACDDNGILRALAHAPMRPCQIAARCGLRRYACAMMLASLAQRGRVICDDEGFYFALNLGGAARAA